MLEVFVNWSSLSLYDNPLISLNEFQSSLIAIRCFSTRSETKIEKGQSRNPFQFTNCEYPVSNFPRILRISSFTTTYFAQDLEKMQAQCVRQLDLHCACVRRSNTIEVTLNLFQNGGTRLSPCRSRKASQTFVSENPRSFSNSEK
jgi:hypothetical protein